MKELDNTIKALIFGKRLRDLREEKLLTQEDLAKKVGLTKFAVSTYERGVRNPSFEVLVGLADALDVDINYLLANTDERKPYPRMTEEEQNQIGAELAREEILQAARRMIGDRKGVAEDEADFNQKALAWTARRTMEVTSQEEALIRAIRAMDPSARDEVYAKYLKSSGPRRTVVEVAPGIFYAREDAEAFKQRAEKKRQKKDLPADQPSFFDDDLLEGLNDKK